MRYSKTYVPETWRQLVTPGHMWAARLDDVSAWAKIAGWAGLLLAIGSLLAVPVVAQFVAGTRAEQAAMEPPTLGSPAPQVDVQKFFSAAVPASMEGWTRDDVSSATDFSAVVDAHLAALNATGKLSAEYPHGKLVYGQPWVSSTTGKPDTPFLAGADGLYWMGALILDYRGVVPIFGALRKNPDGKWAWYAAAESPARSRGHATVSLMRDVPRAFAAAFPAAVLATSKGVHK